MSKKLTEIARKSTPHRQSTHLLWERWSSEPDYEWAWFLRARDGGAFYGAHPGRRAPRTLLAEWDGEADMPTESQLKRMARTWSWGVRFREYDRHLDRTGRVRTDKVIKEAWAKQRRVCAQMLEMCNVEMGKYLKMAKDSDFPLELTPDKLARVAEAAIKMERLMQGESTENVAHNTGAAEALKELSTEELYDLQKITKKLETGVN